MIKLMEIKANDEAVDDMVLKLKAMGFSNEEALGYADKSLAIALAFLRGLDKPIMDAATDELDRSMIQQLVMLNLVVTAKGIMEALATQELMNFVSKGYWR